MGFVRNTDRPETAPMHQIRVPTDSVRARLELNLTQPSPGYTGYVEGIRPESRYGGTYGSLRNGEDELWGELWRKAGPQARTKSFLIGAPPGYGGHRCTAEHVRVSTDEQVSTDVQLDMQESVRSASESRLSEARNLPYVSSFDRRGKRNQQLNSERKSMCPWHEKKHQVPGYTGHVPLTKSDILGKTYTKASVAGYDAVHPLMSTPSASRSMEWQERSSDSAIVEQRRRALWPQAHGKPVSAARLELHLPAEESIEPRKPKPSDTSNSPTERKGLIGDSEMEGSVGLLGDAEIRRLPITLHRRPVAKMLERHKPPYMNASSLSIGNTAHMQPQHSFTTTYGTSFDLLAHSIGVL